jgi:hypothetical protein
MKVAGEFYHKVLRYHLAKVITLSGFKLLWLAQTYLWTLKLKLHAAKCHGV